MAIWNNKTVGDGWTSVVFGTDRLVIADVLRQTGARPRVRYCDNFAREGSDLDALKRLKNAKRVAHNRCTTLLWHGQYQLLQIDLPGNARELPRNELRDSLRWRIKEIVGFPVETAGIDILDIPAIGSRNPQMWVVTASRETLQPRVHLFQDAKTPLDAIDIPELAQRNLAALFEEPNRGLALVAFDTKGGRLTITYQGELFMTRYIDVSGPELADHGGETLHERVLLDIQRSLDNFDRTYSSIPLTRLLVGPLPGGESFIQYLGDNLSLPVESASLTDVLDLQDAPNLNDLRAQAASWLALGAALRD